MVEVGAPPFHLRRKPPVEHDEALLLEDGIQDVHALLLGTLQGLKNMQNFPSLL